MNRLRFFATLLLVLLVVGFATAFFLYESYGTLIELNNRATSAHLRYETALRPLSGLQEDLVELVEPYIGDSEILDSLRAAGDAVRSASRISDRVEGLNRRTRFIERAVQEAAQYPQLKTSPEFRLWLDQFEELESAAAHDRKDYNHAAEQYNDRAASFPTSLMAMIFSLPSRPLLDSPHFTVTSH